MTTFRRTRIAYLYEFDRRGGDYAGTPEQQEWVRQAFERVLVFNNPLDRVARRLARLVKYQFPLTHTPITFESNIPFGRASRNHIWLNRDLDGPELVEAVLWHEIGHQVGLNFFNPIDNTEGWAEEFRTWAQNGCPPVVEGLPHATWWRLTEAQPDL